MNLLLDTHVLLWLAENSPSLSSSARAAITDGANRALYSVVSLWEISIKVGLKKLHTQRPLEVMFGELDSRAPELRLALRTQHMLEYAKLPLHHRDPFDRMIIAQAKSENLMLVSNDEILDAYGVPRVW